MFNASFLKRPDHSKVIALKKISYLRSVLLALGVFVLQNIYGQELPQIIPPSPIAQTFMRYGEIPIDYSTGVPSIEIPIFTLEGRKLKIPISISYHASGIKVNDIASEVGLGWALNCGGMVSKSVNGIRDEFKSGIRTFFNADELLDSLNIAAPIWDTPSTSLKGIMDFERFLNENFNHYEDPMNDRYFYKLPNGPSGVFTYDYYEINDDENSVITLPYRPFKIEKFVTGTKINGFKITDENGIVYKFAPYLVQSSSYNSEWFLTEMVSADATDTIKFYYSPQNNISILSRSHVYSGPAKDIVGLYCYPEDPISSMSTFNSPVPGFNTPILDSIVSSKAVVKFEYSNRIDSDYLKRLVEITIASKNSPNDIIRSVQFTPKYFGSVTDNNARLGLDNIVISVPGDIQSQKYSFTYEAQVLPPYQWSDHHTYSEDFWGYYNGANSNTLIPRDFILNSFDKQSFGGNRDPDPTGYYSRACMLKEIRYPTGGRTVFQFERHFDQNVYPYKSDPAHRDGYVGGFRVASISNHNENDEVTNIKTYEYKYPETRQITKNYYSYDQKLVQNTITEGGPETPPTTCYSSFSREMVLSNPLLPLDVAPGLPVMYGEVIEYNGTKTGNIGKTVYKYKQPHSPPLIYNLPWFNHPYQQDGGNYVPELISKTVFSFDGTNYHPVSREKHEYTKLFTTEFNTGIKLTRLTIYDRPEYFVFSGCNDIFSCDLLPEIAGYINSVMAIDTRAYSEASLLTNNKTYTFDPLDSTRYVLTSTDYSYKKENLAVKEKSTLSSKGKLLKTTYKYPLDFYSSEPYQTMVAKRIYSPVIEQSDSNGSKLLSKTKINYKDWGNNIIEPEYIQIQNGNNGPMETRINYFSYDQYGNLTGIRKANDLPVSYLWGYNQSLPVSKIENCQYRTFAREWTGSFNYIGSMDNHERYTMIGSCSVPQEINATVTRIYYKGNDHQVTFGIHIYDANHNEVKYYSDVMTTGQTSLTVSNQITLPAGEYTVEADAAYESGTSYSHEFEVNFYGTEKRSFPFYTSFEEDEAQISYSGPKTGEKCHVGTYVLDIPSSSSGYNQVVISFWGKTNASAQWTYIEETVNTGSVSSMTIGNGYAFIDEVRMHPVDAKMTTYTYKPLVGMTSQTDANGNVTYFEYDYGRLREIKDNKGNILTQYDYNIFKPEE